MPVPDLEAWRERWNQPDSHHMGIRPLSVSEGNAAFAVDLPYGDDRDGDPNFAIGAIAYVADIAALSAVLAYLSEGDRPNGTTSLHLDHLARPDSRVTVEACVAGRNHMEVIVDLVAREHDERLVMKGLATFALRPGSVKDV